MQPADPGPRKFRLHRGRTHVPKPPPEPPCPISQWEVQVLATYNSEVARGLLHTMEWQAYAAGLQRQFDRWRRRCTDAYNRWSLDNSDLDEVERQQIARSLGLDVAS
jgi:hypothetical protein